MPEAIEIRIICEYLNKKWTNQTIVSFGWDTGSKFHKTGIKGLELAKVPCKVVGVFSRGKLIIIECITTDNKTIYMVSQLGMEGKWIHAKDVYSNFRIYFGSLQNDKYKVTDTWYFSDSRHFGHFNIYSDFKEIDKAHGPCWMLAALLSENIVHKHDLKPYQTFMTFNHFRGKINDKRLAKKEICDFLMKQKYGSGIGNYLRAEIQYRAKISPHKLLSSFSYDDILVLYNCIIKQLLISYGAKGLTIKSYWDPEGNKGKCPLQVYNRKEDPFGNKVETFKDKERRTVHWVPAIQK